jgi:hypothetical protein
MKAGPSMGIPIIHNLYRSPLTASMPFFKATNSAPKTEVSMVGCHFEYQINGTEFKKTKKPVHERLIN